MAKLHHSRIPAWLDYLQSLSGLLLALFIVGHILFEASILFGPEAMEKMTLFFEGYYLFGSRHPVFITILGIVLFVLLIVHAATAIRKFPLQWKQYRIFREHMKRFGHEETSLWMVQVVTGFAIFFLAPVHLYMMTVHPDRIGPLLSGERVVDGWMWPLYLFLLFAVVLHAFVGLYRLALKWGWFEGRDYRASRKIMRWVMRIGIVVYILVGLASLGTYTAIGLVMRDKPPTMSDEKTAKLLEEASKIPEPEPKLYKVIQ